MNKKKLKIIAERLFTVFMDIGRTWVIGMSIILLTYLYVDSSLPKNGFFAILWLAGCIEILFRTLIINDAKRGKDE